MVRVYTFKGGFLRIPICFTAKPIDGPGGFTLYVTPFLDQNLSMTRSGAAYYYSHDGLGSVRTLTDSSGAFANRYDYTAWGEIFAPGTSAVIPQRYSFTGRECNPTSPLMYYRYRQYDPGVGRFSGRDPAAGRVRGMYHPYLYGEMRPHIYADPVGLLACEHECAGEGFSVDCQVVEIRIVPGGYPPDYADVLKATARSVDLVNRMTNLLTGVYEFASGVAETAAQSTVAALAVGTVQLAEHALPGWPTAHDFYDWGNAWVRQYTGVDVYVTVSDTLCCKRCCKLLWFELWQFYKEKAKGSSERYMCGKNRLTPQMPQGHTASGKYRSIAEAHGYLPGCIGEAMREICVDRPHECPAH